ncbi:uncharacterized protein ATNIH1004_010083 [Aspergillus tanneri]|uniref:catalase n=1 Tax=Aspergillus tanneri TaxID=1220188 RepID=A0A5M9MC89_9EURO|nr:uncharacterized protein ATNIH1004_010083 [Aspergillus tanneri]KAA8643316.1 hypothetical protein ATNIH1004_010083 [Aspergillus tanneri]
MAAVIVEDLSKSQEAAQNASSKDRKLVDLANDTTNVHNKQPLTADHGERIRNTNQWLLPVDEDNSRLSLQEDQIIHRFDCERVPERVLYARGTGAFGNFQLLEGAEDVTYAGVLTDTSRNTPVFVRFSTV